MENENLNNLLMFAVCADNQIEIDYLLMVGANPKESIKRALTLSRHGNTVKKLVKLIKDIENAKQ